MEADNGMNERIHAHALEFKFDHFINFMDNEQKTNLFYFGYAPHVSQEANESV